MNVKLGKYNQLEVVKEVDFGVYLDGGDDGEILLPTRYVPEGCKPGDVLNVFLYLDNEERLIATTFTAIGAGGRVLPVWKWHGLMSWCRFELGINERPFCTFP